MAVELSINNGLDDNAKEKIMSLTKGTEKIAYLTFDDGPTLRATPRVLDILKEENVKASFFVIGKYVDKHPELVKRAYDDGHYIANHGYDHSNKKLYESNTSFINEVKKTDIEIGKAIGIDNYCSHIFRFPNGYMSPNNKSQKKVSAKLLQEMDYVYVDWNCLNNDSVKKYSNYQLLNNLKKSAKNKGTLVVLMHDTSDVNDTPSILKDSIDYLKSEGYVFKNFYDLL
jgi:polysaccharide deacetylase